MSLDEFFELVQRHLDGMASEHEADYLRAHERGWVAALLRLYDDTELALDRVNRELRGNERAIVVADFESELRRIDDLLTELVGPPADSQAPAEKAEEPPAETGTPQLQLSWVPGRVVAWAAGHNASPESADQLAERLAAAGAGSIGWETHPPVKLPSGVRADAVSVPIEASLGWLTALGRTAEDDQTGPSVAWIGLVTALAVRLVAQGRMVPQLKKARRSSRQGPKKDDRTNFAVRWGPALVEADEFKRLAASVPGAVSVLETRPDAKAMTNAVLGDLITAICTEAASRLDVPAGPPEP
ncbi:MAG: hypothetical protein AAFN30_07725, partial [Actinomycetota bacterium]